jgi:hypothetical protein
MHQDIDFQKKKKYAFPVIWIVPLYIGYIFLWFCVLNIFKGAVSKILYFILLTALSLTVGFYNVGVCGGDCGGAWGPVELGTSGLN